MRGLEEGDEGAGLGRGDDVRAGSVSGWGGGGQGEEGGEGDDRREEVHGEELENEVGFVVARRMKEVDLVAVIESWPRTIIYVCLSLAGPIQTMNMTTM